MSTSNIKPIIFYDYDGSKSPTRAWSNDSWRGRFALNMNGVPHETEWLEYGQVEKATSAVGVPANGTRFLEGTPLYTLPAIKDPNTDAAIVDSKKIAQYIAKQYPNPSAPDLFPEGTEELQTKFRDEFNTRVHYPIMLLNIYRAGQQINPRSWPFFRPAREAMFKSKLEDIAPDGSEKKAKHVQEVLEGLVYTGEWIDRENKERGTNGPFLFGDKPSFADVDVAACLLYLYIMHKDDGEGGAWDTIAKAEGGRWDRYLHEFDKWREVY